MHFICITDDASPDDLREAIGHLRAKQLNAEAGINDLLDRLPRCS